MRKKLQQLIFGILFFLAILVFKETNGARKGPHSYNNHRFKRSGSEDSFNKEHYDEFDPHFLEDYTIDLEADLFTDDNSLTAASTSSQPHSNIGGFFELPTEQSVDQDSMGTSSAQPSGNFPSSVSVAETIDKYQLQRDEFTKLIDDLKELLYEKYPNQYNQDVLLTVSATLKWVSNVINTLHDELNLWKKQQTRANMSIEICMRKIWGYESALHAKRIQFESFSAPAITSHLKFYQMRKPMNVDEEFNRILEIKKNKQRPKPNEEKRSKTNRVKRLQEQNRRLQEQTSITLLVSLIGLKKSALKDRRNFTNNYIVGAAKKHFEDLLTLKQQALNSTTAENIINGYAKEINACHDHIKWMEDNYNWVDGFPPTFLHLPAVNLSSDESEKEGVHADPLTEQRVKQMEAELCQKEHIIEIMKRKCELGRDMLHKYALRISQLEQAFEAMGLQKPECLHTIVTPFVDDRKQKGHIGQPSIEIMLEVFELAIRATLYAKYEGQSQTQTNIITGGNILLQEHLYEKYAADLNCFLLFKAKHLLNFSPTELMHNVEVMKNKKIEAAGILMEINGEVEQLILKGYNELFSGKKASYTDFAGSSSSQGSYTDALEEMLDFDDEILGKVREKSLMDAQLHLRPDAAKIFGPLSNLLLYYHLYKRLYEKANVELLAETGSIAKMWSTAETFFEKATSELKSEIVRLLEHPEQIEQKLVKRKEECNAAIHDHNHPHLFT